MSRWSVEPDHLATAGQGIRSAGGELAAIQASVASAFATVADAAGAAGVAGAAMAAAAKWRSAVGALADSTGHLGVGLLVAADSYAQTELNAADAFAADCR